jgi:hypothetical protein
LMEALIGARPDENLGDLDALGCVASFLCA